MKDFFEYVDELFAFHNNYSSIGCITGLVPLTPDDSELEDSHMLE
jgi:hypothetical protein